MATLLQSIAITARMREVRAVAHQLFGARYSEIIDPWSRVLVGVGKEHSLGVLEAGLWLAKDCEARRHILEGVDILAMTAAMVDQIESDAALRTH